MLEGRSREAIWRDGRFFDEIHMSVLADEWQGIAVASSGRGRRRPRLGAPRDRAPRRSDGGQPSPTRPWMTSRAGSEAAGAFRAHLEPGGTSVENPGLPRPSSRRRCRRRLPVRRPWTGCSCRPRVALDADVEAGEKLGAKSAEAARFILRAISRNWTGPDGRGAAGRTAPALAPRPYGSTTVTSAADRSRSAARPGWRSDRDAPGSRSGRPGSPNLAADVTSPAVAAVAAGTRLGVEGIVIDVPDAARG